MSEKFSPQMSNHLYTLQRYMSALDAGDLATLAVILHEAERDPALERLLLATNEVYQFADDMALSQAELVSAQRIIANLDRTASGGQESEGATNQAAPTHPKTRFHLLPKNLSGDEEKEMITNDPRDFTTAHSSEQPAREARSKQKRPKFGWLQSLAAVLVVGALVGGFLLVFANHRNTGTGSHPKSVPSATGATTANLLIETFSNQKNENIISAMQAETGAPVWSYNTHQKFVTVQITTQNQVVYAALGGQVYAFRAQTGKIIWQKNLHLSNITETNSTSSLTFDHGMLYLAFVQTSAGGSNLYALNAQNGTLVWHHAIGYDLTFTASNGTVYLEISSADITPGSVTALRGSDGHFLWSYPTNPIAMLVANNILYVQSAHQQTPSDQGGNKQNKQLLALNTTNGHPLWSINVEDDGPSSLVSSNNLVILYRTLSQPKGAEFCAYRSNDGSQAWCTSGKQGPWDMNTSSYLVANGTLYVSFDSRLDSSQNQNPALTVEALNPQTGTVLWSKQLPGGMGASSLATLHGVLYLTINGNIVALRTSDGHFLWQIQAAGLNQSLTANT